MSAPVRNFQQGTFFITIVCSERRRVFQKDTSAQLMFDVLQHYRSIYRLHAFVIMPEHLHVLLTPLITLERAVQSIKGGFSKRYHDSGGKHAIVWQRSYTDRRICDRRDFDEHKTYIELNPVKRSWSRARPSIHGRPREKQTSAAKAGPENCEVVGTAEAVPFCSSGLTGMGGARRWSLGA